MRIETDGSTPERPYRRTIYDLANLYSRFWGISYNVREFALPADRVTIGAIVNGRTYTETADQFARDLRFKRRVMAAAIDNPEDAIRFSYQVLLRRPADEGGIAHYKSVLETQPATEIVNGILGSDEYRRNMVSSLYQEVLERDADPEGLSWYVEGGRPLFEIAEDMKSSDEYHSMADRNFNKIVFDGASLPAVLNMIDTLGVEEEVGSDPRVPTLEEQVRNLTQDTQFARSQALVRRDEKIRELLAQLQQANSKPASADPAEIAALQKDVSRFKTQTEIANEKRTKADETLIREKQKGAEQLRLIESLTIQVQRLRAQSTGRVASVYMYHGAIDFLLLALTGYDRSTLITADASSMPPQQILDVAKGMRRLASVIWHPDSGRFPNTEMMQNANVFLDQLEKRARRNGAT